MVMSGGVKERVVLGRDVVEQPFLVIVLMRTTGSEILYITVRRIIFVYGKVVQEHQPTLVVIIMMRVTMVAGIIQAVIGFLRVYSRQVIS